MSDSVYTGCMPALMTPCTERDGERGTWIGMPWAVAAHRGLWAVYCAHMAFNFGAYYLTNWSPTYYKEVPPPAAARAALASLPTARASAPAAVCAYVCM